MAILADSFYYQPIRIDTINTRVFADIVAKEGDANGRGLILTLTENGLMKDTTGIALNLKWEHTSVGNQGLDSFEAVDLSKGLYKITYPTEMLNRGKIRAFIQIIDSGKLAGTRNIEVTVDRDVGDDTAIASSDSFSALAQALIDVNNLESTYAPRLLSAEQQLADTAKYINVMAPKYNAKGDGITNDTAAIESAIADMVDGSVLYFPTPANKYLISRTLKPAKNNIKILGEYSNIGFANGVDLPVFEFLNQTNVNVEGIASSNTTTAQTFIKATSTHHLHVSNGSFDGMKLGFDFTDCYWPKLESLRFQSIYKFFDFKSATNVFHVVNVSVNGEGVPSTIFECTAGGNITGSCFEGKSGRLAIQKSSGINIDGNYFEGYDAINIANYIAIGGGNYKDTSGINISGNMFYAGSKCGIFLANVDGINIAGNYFGTINAVNLYSFDASNQTNISYMGNSFAGADADEFLISGVSSQASISPELNFPMILKPKVLGPRTLSADEIAIYNSAGKLKSKTGTQEKGIAQCYLPISREVTSNEVLEILNDKFTSSESVLLIVSTFISNSEQPNGVYLVQSNINNTSAFVVPIVDNPKCTVVVSGVVLNVTNIDTVTRFMMVKVVQLTS